MQAISTLPVFVLNETKNSWLLLSNNSLKYITFRMYRLIVMCEDKCCEVIKAVPMTQVMGKVSSRWLRNTSLL